MSLRAAILGAGNMGKCHGENLVKLGVTISAICDTSEKARESFKQSLDLPLLKEYSCFDKMLEENDFDMLFICLPPFAQNDQFQRAVAAGKHVFIEKPIALNTNKGKEMVEAAEKANVITQVGFHMRYGAAVKKLIELIDDGKTGRPVSFNGQYECNALHTWWWVNASLCGGQVFEQAIHLYDMCRYLIGHPKFVCGLMGNVCHSNMKDYTVEDVSASIAGFTNGAISTITATNCAVPGLWEGKFTVVFENLTAFFETPNKARFAFTNGENVRYENIDEEIDMKLDEVKTFIEAVISGNKVNCSIKEGYLSLCYVESVVKSAKLDGAKIIVQSL